jgi:hypothetical protein
MAHFYGTVEGETKQASRCGNKRSGLVTQAASWQGCVRVRLYHENGKDMARVSLERWEGKGTSRVLYDGPVSGAPVAVAV